MITFDFQDKFIPEKEYRLHIKTSQNCWEFEKYAEWIVQEFNLYAPLVERGVPFNYLEIGSYAGESLYYMSQILPRGSQITMVDLPTNEHARKILLERVASYCIKKYGMVIKLISGDTLNPEVAAQTLKYANRYDLCFIDANHEFAFALNDFMMYRDKAQWISFHDISRWNTLKTINKYGVIQANANHLWEVLKVMIPQYSRRLGMNNDEIVDDDWLEFIAYNNEPMPTSEWGQIKPRGIGVLRSQW